MENGKEISWRLGLILLAIAGVFGTWFAGSSMENRVGNSTIAVLPFLISLALNVKGHYEKSFTEKHVRMLNYEVKVANRLLLVSIAADDTGVRKALDKEARELNNAFAAENSFQQLNQSVQDKDEKFIPWAKARDEARVTKMNFWALVNKAKDLGLDVPDGVEFRNFIIKTKI